MRALKHSARFLSMLALVLSVALLGTAGISAAANPLLCFSGTTDTAAGTTGGVVFGGTCTLSPDGMSAVLNNSVPVGSGDYSGVYYASTNLSGKLASDITQLSFDYTGPSRRPLPEAYERLIFDALRGDPTLFMRADELEAAWGFVTPILEAWAARGPNDLASYPAGSWGPSQADELARGCQGGWRRP